MPTTPTKRRADNSPAGDSPGDESVDGVDTPPPADDAGDPPADDVEKPKKPAKKDDDAPAPKFDSPGFFTRLKHYWWDSEV